MWPLKVKSIKSAHLVMAMPQIIFVDKVTVTINFSDLLPHVDVIKRLSFPNSLPTGKPMYSDPLCSFPHACKAL